MPPRNDPAAAGPDARDAEIERLLARLAAMTQQFFEARDAAIGAEAERAVALARLREVEHRLHVKTEEAEELATKIGRLTRTDSADGQRSVTASVPRRLSPILGRAVKLPQ